MHRRKVIFIATSILPNGLPSAGRIHSAAAATKLAAKSMSQAIKDKSKSNSSSPAKQKAAPRPDRQRPLLVLLKGAVLSCVGPNVGEKRWEQVAGLLSAPRIRHLSQASGCDFAPVPAEATPGAEVAH